MDKVYVEQRDDGYWITSTRVSLDSIVEAFNRGAAPETIRRSFPLLSLEEVYGAITFYLAHEKEIDEYLQDSYAALDNQADERREQLKASKPELYERLLRAREEKMTRRSIALIIGLVLVCLGLLGTAGVAGPASPKAEDDFQLVKVADGVFATIAKPGGLASGNAGFIVGDGGVLVVDTFFTPIAIEEMIGEIGKQTQQPIKYAVNTHYHLDHTGGNQVLAARNVSIIAHDNLMTWQTTKNRRFLPLPEELQKRRADTAKQLSETPEDQKDKRTQLERQLRRLDAMLQIKLTNPSVTFNTGTMHLYLGTREVVLFSLPGHTGGDVLVYVPDANVMFTGDMGWSQTLPNLVDATVNDWIPSLDKILANHPAAKFVPGHGEVATAADMRDFRDYLDDLRSRVKKGIADGLTIEQAKEQLKLPEKYKSLAFQNFAQPNVEDMYKELKGTKQTK